MKMIDVSKYIIKYRKLIFLFFVFLTGFGVYSYIMIPKQDMPEFNTPYMTTVVTSYGSSATEINEYIIKDIYELSTTYKDILNIETSSYNNYGVISYEFSFNTENPDELADDIFNKTLEHEFSLTINNFNMYNEYLSPLAVFSLSSEILTYDELKERTLTISNSLKNIEGIRDFSITSNDMYQYRINIDEDLLSAYSLNFEYVYYVINSSLSDTVLGNITIDNNVLSIYSSDIITDIDSLNEIVLISNYDTLGSNLYLSDVSDTEIINTSNKLYYADNEETIFISLFAYESNDVTKLDKEISKVINASDIQINKMVYMIDDVNYQLSNVFLNLAIALVIVFVVMIFGINLRISLINIFCTVIVVFGTIAVLYVLGYELHKLTVVGIIVSIGILVDNMVVIGEGINYHLDEGFDTLTSVRKSIKKNSVPLLSSTLTTIAAFFSITLIGGFFGEVIRSMPITVIIMIVLSYLVSMLFLPLVSIYFFKRKKLKKVKSFKTELWVKKVVRKGISYPLLLLSVSMLFLGGTGYLVVTRLNVDIYPIDEKRALYIDIHDSSGFDLSNTYNLYTNIVSLLDEETEIEHYYTSIGGDLPKFHFSSIPLSEGANNGRVFLNLNIPISEIPDYKIKLEEKLDLINPNYSVRFLELSPPEVDLSVKISSDNLSELLEKSNILIPNIRDIDGVYKSNVFGSSVGPRYKIEYDQEKMILYGISKTQIDSMISLYSNGFFVDNVLISDNLNNVLIYSDDFDIDTLLNINVRDISNNSYPLSTFISFGFENDYVLIKTTNQQFTTLVDIDVADGKDINDVKDEIKTLTNNDDFENIEINYGGINDMFVDIIDEVIQALIVSLLLIYLFIFIQFNSFVKPLIVYLTIPLSFGGSLLFMLIFKSYITATSLIGLVSLIGVTVNTGILLVEYIDYEVENGTSVKEACVNAVYLRFKAILLTSLTTVLGLIPLLVNGGDFFSPLAVTFMGGIFTSMILTLFLVPGMYNLIFNKKSKAV